MRAYPYVRFSTPKQEKGDSLRRQRDLIEGFCKANDWTIDTWVQDLGQSAWTGEHLKSGSLGRFAEDVRAGKIEMPAVLVVEKLDRLSRQGHRTALRWMEDLCDCGLTIAVVDGGRLYDTKALAGDLMPTIEILMRAKLAFDESQQKSDRVLDAIGKNMRRAAAGGAKISRKAPGWLTLSEDRQTWLVNDHRAQVVRDIYQMAADGAGARWIAKWLNDNGEPAWGYARKDGKPRTWEISSVRLILAQPSVEGDYVPGFANTSKDKRTKFVEPILGYFPRIVDADLVAKARAQVEGRKTGSRDATGGTGGRRAGVANLFAGQVRCGGCGNRMHLRSNGEQRLPKRYLQCHHAARSRGCQQREMFAYDPLEEAVLDQILHLALDDRHFARVDESGRLAVELAEIGKQLADGEDKARRLVRVLAMVDDDPAVVAELKDVRAGLTAQARRRDEVAGKLAQARGAVSPEEHLARVRDLREAFGDPDQSVRQAARLRVQTAMKGLDVRLTCDVKDGVRSTHVMLRTGWFCRVEHDGKVRGIVDLPSLAARYAEGEPDQALAAAELLTEAFDMWGRAERGEPILHDGDLLEADPVLVERLRTHLGRQQRHEEEVLGSAVK
jgi:DNA invertase Pin-like site-specific DNA recombinase